MSVLAQVSYGGMWGGTAWQGVWGSALGGVVWQGGPVCRARWCSRMVGASWGLAWQRGVDFGASGVGGRGVGIRWDLCGWGVGVSGATMLACVPCVRWLQQDGRASWGCWFWCQGCGGWYLVGLGTVGCQCQRGTVFGHWCLQVQAARFWCPTWELTLEWIHRCWCQHVELFGEVIRESKISVVLFAGVILYSHLTHFDQSLFPLGHKMCKVFHMSVCEHHFEIIILLTIVLFEWHSLQHFMVSNTR